MSQLGQTLLLPGKGYLRGVVYDNFTDTDGTAVESHVSPNGGTWALQTGGGAGSSAITGGEVFNPNSATVHHYYHSWLPSSPDYAVECDLIMKSDNDLSMAGPGMRLSTSAATGYRFYYNTAGNLWQIRGMTTGTDVVLGTSVGATLVVDQVYRVRIEATGPHIRGYVDGVLIADRLDTDAGATPITAAGRVGLGTRNNATATTGVHLDNWRVFAL